MNEHTPTPDQNIDSLHGVPPRPPDNQSPGLEIVSRSTLTLCQPTPDLVPVAWETATTLLAQQSGFNVRRVPKRTAFRLKKMIAWASATPIEPPAPVFTPWRCSSPEALQHAGQLALPCASWVSAYAFGMHPKGRQPREVIDIMLMSPLPAGCAPDNAIPQPQILQAMIEAARRENRKKVTIVTDARRRNGIIMHLLLLKLADNSDKLDIEVLSVENALRELAADPASGDAIIVLPDLRSLVFAMLAEATAISGPWPLVWHDRDARMISCEALGDICPSIPLDISLLTQALALAANKAGLISSAQRLARLVTTLWEWGAFNTSGRFAARDRAKLSDEDLIKQLGRSAELVRGSYPLWHGVAPHGALARANVSHRLTLVHSTPASGIKMPAG